MVVVVLCGALSVARADQRDGAFLYGAYCASCHGADARGHGPEASLFSPPPRNLRGGTLASYTDEDLVERIVEAVNNKFEDEVPAEFIGKQVMDGLRGIDEVAYVRFASVYRRFQEATDFVSEVKKLESKE